MECYYKFPNCQMESQKQICDWSSHPKQKLLFLDYLEALRMFYTHTSSFKYAKYISQTLGRQRDKSEVCQEMGSSPNTVACC